MISANANLPTILYANIRVCFLITAKGDWRFRAAHGLYPVGRCNRNHLMPLLPWKQPALSPVWSRCTVRGTLNP